MNDFQWAIDLPIRVPLTEGLSKLGIRVVMSESASYNHSDANPRDMGGTIHRMDEGSILPLHVKWDNGYSNRYSMNDLIVIEHE